MVVFVCRSASRRGGINEKSVDRVRIERDSAHLDKQAVDDSPQMHLVERQPFGGYKLSGIGSKAGGPDYLLQFLIPINVTENTLRRGFAPPPPAKAK